MRTATERGNARSAPPRVGDPGDVTYLIAVIRRRRGLIATFILVGLAASLAYLLVATPQYRATTRVLIDFRRLTDIGQDQLASNNRVNDSAVDSQATIMTSEGVVRTVIRTLKLDEDPEFREDRSRLDRLLAAVGLGDSEVRTEAERERYTIEEVSRRLSAMRVGVSYVIELRFLSEDAAKAARISNALAAAYVADQLGAKQEAAGSANTWYRKRVAELQGQANDAEKAAVEYRARNQIMLADGKFIDEQQLTDLSTRLITSQSDRTQAQAKLDQIAAMLRNGGDGAVSDEFQNGLITGLRQKLAEINRRIADTAARYGTDHEAVERGRSDLRSTQASITDEFQRIAAGYRSSAAVAKLNEEAVTRELEEVAKRSSQAQTVRVELAQLQSFADTYKTMRDGFLSRFAEAAQEQTFPITEARIISEAAEPTRPASPNWYKTLAGGLAAGFGLGFLVALGRDVLSRRVRDRKQLEAAVGRPCLTVIGESAALAAAGAGRVEEAAYKPFSAFAENMRSIRLAADAVVSGEGDPPGTVLGIVSAVPEEGTTTVAANLAALLARSGSPTLLIDLDFRRRALSALTQDTATDDGTAGLQDVLDGRSPIGSVVRRRPASGLHVLPASAGPDRLHPADRIASPQFSNFLGMARNSYRYVVLDLPPMLPVADARATAGMVDGFVMVSRWNSTTLDDLQNAVSLNPELARKLIGVVLNRADPAVLAFFDDTVLTRSMAYLRRTASAARVAPSAEVEYP